MRKLGCGNHAHEAIRTVISPSNGQEVFVLQLKERLKQALGTNVLPTTRESIKKMKRKEKRLRGLTRLEPSLRSLRSLLNL